MKLLEEFVAEIKKFGQKKAAMLSGVSVQTINTWCTKNEKWKRIPTLVNAQKVAEVMGMEFLLFDKID